MIEPSYKKAFYCALGLHFFLIVLLLSDSNSQRPVLEKEHINSSGLQATQDVAKPVPQEIVKAVNIDAKEVTAAVNRLKDAQVQRLKAEADHQKALLQQAQAAKQQRIKEQKELARLKEETNKIAIARKKQLEEEKKHLKDLAQQREKEAKRLEELKKQHNELVKQQEIEKKRVADMALEKAQADKLKVQKEQEEKQHAEQNRLAKAKELAELEKKKQAKAIAAQLDAERQARMAGEVDKYKALIINAIGRNWILPENADSSASSQFKIRLAPNGTVIEVTLIHSSGDPLLDRSAQTAIYKASPLPVPTDGAAFNLFREISLTVRPEQIRG